jgi:8-hydroxy-5-deazaflavin:NADPH oxidoreductase
VRYAVLGTGTVGRTIGGKLVQLGHEVRMGSRRAGSEQAAAWTAEVGETASEGTFEDAAGFGEVVVNATAGVASVDALGAAGTSNLSGKVLIDIANPLAPDSGMPPQLAFCNTESLGERIQDAFPDARVVKTLNTVNAAVMVDPGSVPGTHNVFVSGNDTDAKAQVTELLQSFGWPSDAVIDLGEISTARGPEMYLAMWLRLMVAGGSAAFNINVVRAD